MRVLFRFFLCVALFWLGSWMLARAAWLFLAAHRLGTTAAPTPLPTDAPDAAPERGAGRYDVRMSIAEIMNRVLH